MISHRTLLRLNGSECCWCGRRLTRRTVTREHLIPRYWGGTRAAANIVPACKPCNKARGYRRGPPGTQTITGWAALWWAKHGDFTALVAQRRQVLRLMSSNWQPSQQVATLRATITPETLGGAHLRRTA